MNRYRAAALHVTLSALVATAVFLVNDFVWYPGALFAHAGGRELLLLVAGVDVAIGPLLTLIVFVPGKKGLAFDLATIAILQVGALSYGTWVLFESRPAWVVFVKDRFELVRANEIPAEEQAKATPGPYASPPWTGPRMVAARMPKDPNEQFRIMMAGMSGTDLHLFPQHYVSYDDVRKDVVSRAAPMQELRRLNPQSAPQIDRLVARHGLPEGELRFLPMRAGTDVDLAVIVDAARGDLLEIAALRPWEFK